jgi:hypothetical protein
MDIAALSVITKHAALMQQVGTAVMKKAMEAAKVNSEAMIKIMEQSVNPNLGTHIDIKV